MNNLKNFFVSLWINVKETINRAATFITNFEYARTARDDFWKAKECLRRASNSYLALSGMKAPNLVTPLSIDRIVRTCHTREDFTKGLENAGARNDELYCIVLTLAIFEVYKSSGPIEISNNIRPLLK